MHCLVSVAWKFVGILETSSLRNSCRPAVPLERIFVGDRSIWMRNFEEDLGTQDWKQTHNSIEKKNTLDGIFIYRTHTLAFHRTPIYKKKLKKRS